MEKECGEMTNSKQTRGNSLRIRMEGHMGCKVSVERIKTRYNEAPACQEQKVFQHWWAKRYRDELLKEMACRFELGRIQPDVVPAFVKAQKTCGG